MGLAKHADDRLSLYTMCTTVGLHTHPVIIKLPTHEYYVDKQEFSVFHICPHWEGYISAAHQPVLTQLLSRWCE